MTFEQQIAEGLAAPIDGWDFSWFDGHATEQRPTWGYSRLVTERLGTAHASLDIETGGAEVYATALAGASRRPSRIEATESWQPNFEIARKALEPLGGRVALLPDTDPLPYDDGAFDLVTTRFPTVVPWQEIARVLEPGGTFLAQLIVHGTNRELYEFMMGPQWVDPVSAEEHARSGAAEAGLEMLDFQQESPPLEFFDLASVIVFLRKVVWTVPGFTVEGYRDRLRAMFEHIEREGSFVSYGRRALVVARKP